MNNISIIQLYIYWISLMALNFYLCLIIFSSIHSIKPSITSLSLNFFSIAPVYFFFCIVYYYVYLKKRSLIYALSDTIMCIPYYFSTFADSWPSIYWLIVDSRHLHYPICSEISDRTLHFVPFTNKSLIWLKKCNLENKI